MCFSANTRFLLKDLPFLDRTGAAAAAGFDAVEFHDEAQGGRSGRTGGGAGARLGLRSLGLNTRMGETSGCAAIPGAEAQARSDIEAAIAVADAVGAGAIHVLSGKTEGEDARACLIRNLRYALGHFGRTILIEPICRAAIPGYFLNDLDQASDIVAEVGDARLRILFDCYHVETEHGHCLDRYLSVAPQVGHVQIASVPGRNEPPWARWTTAGSSPRWSARATRAPSAASTARSPDRGDPAGAAAQYVTQDKKRCDRLANGDRPLRRSEDIAELIRGREQPDARYSRPRYSDTAAVL